MWDGRVRDISEDGRVPSPALTAERVRRDVEVVARAGLDLDDFFEEAAESVRRAVPWVAACLGTQDPGTHLLTSARKYGELRDQNGHDHEFALVEYGEVETTAFTELAQAPSPAAGVHQITNGEIERSGRMSKFMVPRFGFGDEARLVFRDGGQHWGSMALFRGPDDTPFGEAEVAFLASLSQHFAVGVRSELPAGLRDPRPTVNPSGPAVVIVGADDQDAADEPRGPAAHRGPGLRDAAGSPMSPLPALVGAARALRPR